ncbi:MAG: excinuclease ABC subunit UvrC [Deltaproteobacteria bacterium]|nr:excinuclease ABC subunit UvrC [Deltaproteobacteria bacterium]MBW2086199.1 excinuclease ABC subunit UvrC [Deltaproteobacteria bacterium]
MTGKEKLKTKAAILPEAAGVYLMKDARDRVIYVGKAKSLRKRVISYFQKGPSSSKTFKLMNQIKDLEYIQTDTEKEALILENSLIKKHRPRFNVNLRDDKTYPYIRLNIPHPYPRLEVVRRIKRDGALYFGPFSSSSSMRRTMRLIQRLFPLRQCRRADVKAVDRPCLNYQLGRCSAPCVGYISQEDYQALVEEVALFFQGRNKRLMELLEQKMQESSRQLDFEAAAWYRDRLADIKKTLEQQKMVSLNTGDQDVIGLAQDRGQGMAVMLFVRRGVLLGHRNFYLGATAAPSHEVVESLLGQYYSLDNLIPDEILVPVKLEHAEALQEWLKEKKAGGVHVKSPVRGAKKKLVELAATNAVTALAQRMQAAELGAEVQLELQKKLNLPEPPHRIEAFDLSALQGDEPVGAMVVFEDRAWRKSDYRRFRIKSASGQDDYAMMYEVVRRRLQREDLARPDLMLLDGGRGQLSMALAVIKDLKIQDPPPLAGLAKGRDREPDRVWLPGRKNPVNFRPGAPGLLFLMRIRDEAHRYAQAYHRRLRRKKGVRSVLDQIPGVGPARRKVLLKHFGSIQAIKAASIDDLAEAKGLSEAVAENVFNFFHVGE